MGRLSGLSVKLLSLIVTSVRILCFCGINFVDWGFCLSGSLTEVVGARLWSSSEVFPTSETFPVLSSFLLNFAVDFRSCRTVSSGFFSLFFLKNRYYSLELSLSFLLAPIYELLSLGNTKSLSSKALSESSGGGDPRL